MESLLPSISNKETEGEITDVESDLTSSKHGTHGPGSKTEHKGVVSGSLQSLDMEGKGNLVADEIPEEEDLDEEEDDYEYEDDEDAAFSGFLVDNNPAFVVTQATVASSLSANEQPATILEEEQDAPKQKWRPPSEEAVSMSHRAEQEKSGGKRRLAQDLFRIMQQDTKESGFSLKPTSEDSMDKWTIQLFQFDEDSKLAKDMRVLGLENIELEMSFPDQYPFEPPFVRVSRPRFKRQTGFVMNGALCMELLTKVNSSQHSLKKIFLCMGLTFRISHVPVNLSFI